MTWRLQHRAGTINPENPVEPLKLLTGGLSSRAAVSASSWIGVGGAVQFWAADRDARADGTGDGGEDWSALGIVCSAGSGLRRRN